jgi:hypothetical protein
MKEACKKVSTELGMVVLAYNPSYSGGRDGRVAV